VVRASPRVCHRYLELILLLIFFIALRPACALKLENDLQAGFTLSLIHGLSVPSGIDNRLKIGEISLKSTDKEGQIQISIINDLSLIIDANRSIYRKFG